MICTAIKLLEMDEKSRTLQEIASEMGLEYGFLWSFKNGKYKKYMVKNIDIVYNFYSLEKDQRYYNNQRLWNKKTYSVLWDILRMGRIRQWLSVEDVAKALKGDKRQIMRIEHGDSLTSVRSYYITEMLKLYKFSEEEEEKIKRGIVILQDLYKIHNKYESILWW